MTEQTGKQASKKKIFLTQNQKIRFKKMVEAGKSDEVISKNFEIPIENVKRRIQAMGLTRERKIVEKEKEKEIQIEIKKIKAGEAFAIAEKTSHDNYSLVNNLFSNLVDLNALIIINRNRIICAEKERGDKKDDKKHQDTLLKTIDAISKLILSIVELKKELLNDEEIREFKDAIMIWIETKDKEFIKELNDVINNLRFSRQPNRITNSETIKDYPITTTDSPITTTDSPIPITPKPNNTILEK